MPACEGPCRSILYDKEVAISQQLQERLQTVPCNTFLFQKRCLLTCMPPSLRVKAPAVSSVPCYVSSSSFSIYSNNCAA
jgi:hypothetical protein